MSFIYAIQASSGGPVKIGISSNPESRLRQIQTNHHEELVILESVAGDRSLESNLHSRYAENRLMGEWFDLSGEQVQELLVRMVAAEAIDSKLHSFERLLDHIKYLQDRILALEPGEKVIGI